MERRFYVPAQPFAYLEDSSSVISVLALLYQLMRGSCGESSTLTVSHYLFFCSVFLYIFELLVSMDPSALADEWARLSLTVEEEESAVVADREAVDRSGQLLGFYLLGKLLCHRPLGAEVMRRNFRAAWKLDQGLQVDRLGRNLFIFRFVNEADRFRVLRQGP